MLPFALAAVRRPQDIVDQDYDNGRLAALAAGASVGISLYGGAMHAAGGVAPMLDGAWRALVTAGAAWALAIPALVVVSALAGTAVPWRRAVFASLITVNFGGLAFLASIPVVTLLELSIREPAPMLFVHALVVAGVGTCSAVIFDRTMARLEGPGLFHWVWMAVFGVLFLEIGWFMSLFSL
jgi:hypothetical protein